MRNVVRIAHISDIHFRRRFPLRQWANVKAVLRARNPKVLVITGDVVNHPWPLMLILARREILQLADDLGARVLQIPGNHDVAFMGSWPIWPLTRAYEMIFSTRAEPWIRQFPTFEQFYSTGRIRRFFRRLRLYAKILWGVASLKLGRDGPRDDLVKLEVDLPIRAVGFDSNRSLFLASGRVSKEQIQAFGEYASTLSAPVTLEAALLPRIAIVHHHLVPIPYTRRDAAGNESFLVLRNAGTVLRELWQHDFDLVLHGHRHYASFSRIAFDDSYQTSRELAVVSAASPTSSEAEAGLNSFHLIDLHAHGRIECFKLPLGAEMSIHEDDKGFDALSLHAVKVRNYARTRSVMNHSCDFLEREVLVNAVGVTANRIRYRDLGVRAAGWLESRRFETRTDRGSVSNADFRELQEDGLWSHGCFLCKAEDDPRSPREASASVIFDPPLAGTRTVSFGLEWLTQNSFAMSRWELEEFPSGGAAGSDRQQEAIKMRVRFPLRRLSLVLELPDCLHDPRPYAVCCVPANYPVLQIDSNGDVAEPPNGSRDWSPDPDITAYESPFLRQISEFQWEWQIEYPLVGYRYEIHWRVEDRREQTVDVPRAGETTTYRKALVKYAANAYGAERERMPASADAVRKLLASRLLEPIYSLVSPTVRTREVFRLCLFAFDPVSRDLIVVEEIVRGPGRPLTESHAEPVRMPFGEGVAGLSFKQGSAIGYCAPSVGHQRPPVALFRKAEENQLKAILAIPLFHPKAWDHAQEKRDRNEFVTWADLPSKHQAVGVITFASDSEASGLTAFQKGIAAAPLLEAIDQVVRREIPAVFHAIAETALEMP